MMRDFTAERATVHHLIEQLRHNRGTMSSDTAINNAIYALQQMERLMELPHPKNVALWTAIITLLTSVGPADATIGQRKYWAKDYKQFDRAIEMLKEVTGPIEEINL